MRRLLMACVLAGALGCGREALVEEAPKCLLLTEPTGQKALATALPSRVSMLFKVDTCAGEPVSGLEASHFEISEDGRPVSAYESQRRIQPKKEHFRLDSLVLMDLSGSVLRSGDFAALQAAARAYVGTVLAGGGDGQRVALMTFDGREKPQLLVDFTSDARALEAGLDRLSVRECQANADCAGFSDRRSCAGWRCVDDSTNLYGAVVSALEVLDARLAMSDVAWRDAALVLFTDGRDQAARVSAAAALEKSRVARAHLFSVGLGGEVDGQALAALGRDGSWPVAKADQLERAFTAVATRVFGLANRFYLLEYCSPKRSGVHTLKVTAQVRGGDGVLRIGGLSGDFDATGFASGCSF